MVHMKVNRGQKVPLVTTAPHFVVSWLLRMLVVRPLPVIVSTTSWFVVESFCFFSVPFHRSIISSLRMNRVDLKTILTALNMAAMERGTTSEELKVFIRSNIQQTLIGVIGNLMDEKDSIDYLCATIDNLLDIFNRVSSIFCIPSELESSLRRTRKILVDKEDDTMFRKTGCRGRPSIVIPREQLELCLEYGFSTSKVAKLFWVSRGWLSSLENGWLRPAKEALFLIWHDLWKHTVQQPKCKLRL